MRSLAPSLAVMLALTQALLVALLLTSGASRATADPYPIIVVNGSSFYDVVFDSPVPARVNLTAASTAGLPTGDDAWGEISMGFNFSFYGTSYSSLRVTTNGLVQLVSPSASTEGLESSYSYELGNSRYTTPYSWLAPIMAIFWTNLIVKPGQLSYQLIGEAPNRQFVLRFNKLGGTGDEMYWYFSGDLVLNEATSVIEYRYYQTDMFSTVQIGIEAGPNAYLSVWNSLGFTDEDGTQFQGYNVRFVPTGNSL